MVSEERQPSLCGIGISRRLPPPGPEHSQGNPEQLVRGSQSTARSLRVQSQQLLMESQVLKDEVLMGAESAEQPAEEMSERHNHGKNLTETSRNSALCQVIHFAGVRRFGEAQRSENSPNSRQINNSPWTLG